MVLPKEASAPKSAEKINKDVANILNKIKRKSVDVAETTEKPAKQVKLDAKTPKPKSKIQKIPRGQAKSNRPWKEAKQK